MKREIIPDIQSILISGKKSVFIRSWDDENVEVRYPENKDCMIEVKEGNLEISAKSYLIVSIPNQLPVSIEHIFGNLETAGLLNSLVIENVSGNCSIQSVDSLSIQNVSGNCKVGMVNGEGNIKNVSGNFSLHSLGGTLQVNGVGGNFVAKAESIKLSTSVGGNMKINTNQLIGQENNLRAGGSIKLNIMDPDNVVIEAKAGGVASIELADQTEKFKNGKFERTFGAGENRIQLRAGGNIKVSDQEMEFDTPDNFPSVDDEYVDQIEEKYEARSRQTSGFDFSDLFDIDGEIGERIREKTQMADDKIQKAMEKMEKKFSSREEFGSMIPRPPRPPKPPSSPFPSETRTTTKTSTVTTEERMMVLQMLQDKKISAEEADRLLRALE
ncbi:MAG TPA: hypothetical protein VK856_12905 [Anaerolineaceae bacterium]|nr:hypothetical protein [Anaerolineaceae bacterium]